jgi:hypothetical protein
MSDTITVNGEAYDAVPVGEGVWMVHWFQKHGVGLTVEAEVWQPAGVVWTADDAIKAAIAGNSWA